MKIYNVRTGNVNPYKQQMNKNDYLRSNKKQSDKVEISSEAKQLQHQSSIVQKRKEKIEQLKIAIENGTYQIDHQELAKSIYNFYFKK